MRIRCSRLAILSAFALAPSALAIGFSINDQKQIVHCPKPLPAGGTCTVPFGEFHDDWSVTGKLITHNYGGTAGDMILTDFQFLTLRNLPAAPGPGLTLSIEAFERYTLAFPLPLAYVAGQFIDGTFRSAIQIAVVTRGAGGPQSGSSATAQFE